MKVIGRDKLIIPIFLIVILFEVFVHYHDEHVISSLRSKLYDNGILHPGDSNSALKKIQASTMNKYQSFMDFIIQPGNDAARTQLKCQAEQNIFFLKTSKTGSQTMMAIMQRFGIRNNSTFFLGENMNGGLSPLNYPISSEKDCWIGKSTAMTYSMSTQHLKYNRTLINQVMNPGSKFFTIIREPTSNFVSSYRYYQYLMIRLWGQFGIRNASQTKKAPTETLYKEMEHFLSNEKRAWKYLDNVPAGSFARLGTLRPMLLFFGYYRDRTGRLWKSYEKNIPNEILLEWYNSLKNDFDLVMIMEHYDISLAILLIKFCWSIDDVVYLKVNAQAKTGIELSAKAQDTLHKINKPDYLLYSFFNATLWMTVEELGRERVEEVARQIGERSREMAEECIVPSYIEAAATSTKKLKPKLRAEKEDDPDCQLFIAHGPALTKVTQRYMIDRLGKKWKACPKVNAPKNQTGSWADNMERRKPDLRQQYNFFAKSRYSIARNLR